MLLPKVRGKWAAASQVINYLRQPSSSSHYTGWLGYGNLGDELMLDVVARCFPTEKFVWHRDFGSRIVTKAIGSKHHNLAMLGGGTQIGETSPMLHFKKALARSRSGLVFGTGVTPSVDGPVPLWLKQWAQVLAPLPFVGVRGEESAATLRRVGVNAQIIGDLVFFLAKQKGFWRPQPKLVGLNIGQSYGQMYGDESQIQSVVVQFIQRMVADGNEVEFFCVWPEDLAVTLRVAGQAGVINPTVHKHYHDAHAFMASVKHMTSFVGIKLHAVALALCAGVPSIMIEYRPKCRELMKTLDLESFTIRSDEISAEKLYRMSCEMAEAGEAISNKVTRATLAIKNKLEAAATDVAPLFRNTR
jgi:polysaccharide pyruvyl transferase WcaK-like protein